jgi:hypothetical protein
MLEYCRRRPKHIAGYVKINKFVAFDGDIYIYIYILLLICYSKTWLILSEETRDAIRKLRIIPERTLDVDEEVAACFIDWQKAFDRLNWTKLMQTILRKCPTRCNRCILLVIFVNCIIMHGTSNIKFNTEPKENWCGLAHYLERGGFWMLEFLTSYRISSRPSVTRNSFSQKHRWVTTVFVSCFSHTSTSFFHIFKGGGGRLWNFT